MKNHLTACLLASTLIAAPAFAQSTIPSSGASDRPAATAPSGAAGSGAMSAPTAPGATTLAPSTTTAPDVATSPPNPPAGSPPAAGAATMAGSQGGFITMQEQSQVLASKLIGTRVISQADESIGDVNDVLMDSSGRAVAVVVGVGGFLGIGEKNVAVPFEMLEFVKGNAAATTGSTATGTAATTGGAAGSPAASTSSSERGITADPTRIMLKTTKADLQSAPTFRRYDARSDQRTGGAAAPATAPRQ